VDSWSNPKGQFKVRFAELEEFKKTHGTIYFLSEDKNDPPKLASWTFCAKRMTIKVLNKEATSSVLTLIHIKKFVDIGLVPQYLFTYGPGEEEEEDTDDATAAIWSGGTGNQSNIIYFDCACATLIFLNKNNQNGSHKTPRRELGCDQFSPLQVNLSCAPSMSNY
jgi:hypothetical protein